MKFRLKEFIIGTSGLAVVTIPLIAVSLKSNDGFATRILSGKTQMQDAGVDFASYFDNKDKSLSNVKGAPTKTYFDSANGNEILARLATTYGTKRFPSILGLAGGMEVKAYADKGALLKFKDPKYDSYGVSTILGAEEYNKSIAGENINKLLRAAEQNGKPVMKQEDWIVGVPTFTETIGVIYNTKIFKDLGIEVVYGKKPTNATDSIFGANSVITVDSTHKILYTDELVPAAYKNLKTWINSNKSKSSGLQAAQGSVVSGKESWAFSSKVGMVAVIGKAASNANPSFRIGNPHLPVVGSKTTGKSSVAPDLLSMDNVRDLFVNKTNPDWNNSKTLPGNEIYKEAAEMYVNNTSTSETNNNMMDQFVAGHIALMPQGSWEEAYLQKGGFKDFSFLPLSMGTGNNPHIKKGNWKPYLAIDASGYWEFTNFQTELGMSEKKSVAAQTRAINFIYDLYMGDHGKDVFANDMGLMNPYDANAKVDAKKHPLIKAALALQKTETDDNANGASNVKRVVRWGAAYNLPGTATTGFERNNPSYTSALEDYQKDSSKLGQLQEKVFDIWKNAK